MSEIYEVRDYWVTYDDNGTYANFTAIVADVVLTCPATRYEPEQWGEGLCTGGVLLADDELPPGDDNILGIHDLAETVTNWEMADPTPFYEPSLTGA